MKRKTTALLILLIIFTGLLTVLSNLLSSVVEFPSTVKSLAWPLLLLVTAVLISLTVWQFLLQRDTGQPPLTWESQNRQRLLAKVRAFWITDIFERSLQGAALITLGLSEQSEVVENPWRLVLQQPDQTLRSLPPGTRITQIYNDVGGELLILGEPGAGKTTLLLELTRDLLECAKRDENHPMPVIFNLSSWAIKRQPLTDWLIKELNIKYQVPLHLGKSWVEANQVLPLLDGLDEVAKEYRAACVDTINTYRREHGLLPIVICSRSNEYESLGQSHRLLLHSAVIIQPLTLQQVDDYLSRVGGQLEAVRVALRDDPMLRDLVTTPLMLSVLTLAYQGESAEDVLVAGPPETRRQQIFEAYVQRMLQRRGVNTRYTRQRIVYWLVWLAKQLVQRNQTEFYIEWMQPDWLPTRIALRGYRIMLPLVSGLFVGLVIEFGFGLFGLLSHNLLAWLGVGPFYGLIGGAVAAFMSLPNRQIKPTEMIIWSWEHARKTFVKFLTRYKPTGWRLVWYLIVAAGAVSNPIGWVGLLASPIIIALLAIFLGLTSGVSTEMLDKHNRILPNQGIRLSARNGLLAGLLVGLLAGLFVGLPTGLLSGPNNGLRFGLLIGLFPGLIVGLWKGGFACIQHVVLRWRLWRAGYVPLNYPGFLDYATERILLRKVGGGYIFVHRLLLDFFAALNTISTSHEEEAVFKAQQGKQTPHGPDLRYDLTITFEEAVFGCQKEIVLLRYERCPACNGSGAQPGTPLPLCSACQGAGKVRRAIFGQFALDTLCERCHGRGKVITTRCERCHGEGRVRNTRHVVVNIPAGVDNGIYVRVTGEGEVGTYDSPPGNLYVVLTVKPHPFFKRQGNDMLYELPISITQAVHGDEVEVPTVEGKITTLKIPAGTQNNQRFVLKGLGVPVLYSRERGDLYVIVRVVASTDRVDT